MVDKRYGNNFLEKVLERRIEEKIDPVEEDLRTAKKDYALAALCAAGAVVTYHMGNACSYEKERIFFDENMIKYSSLYIGMAAAYASTFILALGSVLGFFEGIAKIQSATNHRIKEQEDSFSILDDV